MQNKPYRPPLTRLAHLMAATSAALVLWVPAAQAQTSTQGRSPLDLDQVFGSVATRTAPVAGQASASTSAPTQALQRLEVANAQDATVNPTADTTEGVEPTVTAVPEPSTFAMLMAGLVMAGGYIRRR